MVGGAVRLLALRRNTRNETIKWTNCLGGYKRTTLDCTWLTFISSLHDGILRSNKLELPSLIDDVSEISHLTIERESDG